MEGWKKEVAKGAIQRAREKADEILRDLPKGVQKEIHNATEETLIKISKQ